MDIETVQTSDFSQNSFHETLRLRSPRVQRWLFGSALPLWWANGADHTNGGFYDKLRFTDAKPLDLPKRVRVLARQIIVFSEAGRLGWQGPWKDAIAHGLDFLPRYQRADGLYRTSVDNVGRPVDDEASLYDQAFVIYALACAYSTVKPSDAFAGKAINLLNTLDALVKHPLAGYRELVKSDELLRSNPHMHMLEALLAWVDLGVEDPFRSRAHEIVTLARDKLIDPQTGAIGEVYDGQWGFLSNKVGYSREPGHQFEWSYLLTEAQRLLGCDSGDLSDGLDNFGTNFGISEGRVLFELDHRGNVQDATSKLWAQTERLRTMICKAQVAPPGAANAYYRAAVESLDTVERHLDATYPGLWRERQYPDGSWIEEAVPASSLYHIITGFSPLLTL